MCSLASRQPLLLGLWLVVAAVPSSAQQQRVELRGDVVLYAPLDDCLRAHLPTAGVGLDPIPTTEMEAAGVRPTPNIGKGVVGGTVYFDRTFGAYLHDVIPGNEVGTVMCWARHDWTAATDETHVMFQIGPRLPAMGSLFRYRDQPYWSWVSWYHHMDQKHVYGPTADISHIEAGQWYHVACTWSWPERIKRVYLDGKLIGEEPLKRALGPARALWLGSGTRGQQPLNGWLDEVYVLDEPLTPSMVKQAYEAGLAGRQAYPIGPPPPPERLVELPRDTAPAPPSFVRWDPQGAWRTDNGLRAETTLNGWWRWQKCEIHTVPPDPGKWLFRRVPALDGRMERFYVHGPDGKPVKDLQPDSAQSWYERRFDVPSAWRGSRVEIEFEQIVGRSAVYLNGTLMGQVPAFNAGASFDVTDSILFNGPNRLTVCTKAIAGDVWLRRTPKGARLSKAWIETSVRKATATLQVRCEGAANTRVRARVVERPGADTAVLEFPVAVVRDSSAALTDELPREVKLWSVENPNLYWYEVELIGADGEVVDRLLPRRFGFREFWIEGDKFVLNGKPTYLYGHSHPHFMTVAECGTPGFAEYVLRRWKDVGLNMTYNWVRDRSLGHVFDVADEIGFLFVPYILPGLTGLDPDYLAGHRRVLEAAVDKYRDHPSVVAWLLAPGGSHAWDMCPGKMDGRFKPQTLSFYDGTAKRLRAMRELVARVDPSRPGFHHSSGNEGPVHGSMAYMTFDVALRERSNWPWLWSQSRHKPVFVCEFGLPMHCGWYARTRELRRQYPNHQAIPLYEQYAAMYFGDEVYSWPTGEDIEKQSKPGAWGMFGRSRAVSELKQLFATENLRAWRTYGISFCLHAEVPDLFKGSTPQWKPDDEPRRPGAMPDYIPASNSNNYQCADELSELGEHVRDLLAPVYVYIGGPDGEFTSTDHSYFPGDFVRKSVIAINDGEVPAHLSYTWRLQDGEEVLQEGSGGGEVRPGDRAITRFEVLCRCPKEAQRKDLRLALQWATKEGAKGGNDFELQVIPRQAPPSLPASRLYLFDPVGDTRKALQALPVGFEELSQALPPAGAVLIIGRHALETQGNRERLTELGLDGAVRSGLNLLVFEQAPEGWEGAVMGLKLREASTRRAFIASPGHPVLRGLAQEDFAHWRGDSDLIAAREIPQEPPAGPYDYPLRFWHWGNDNIVATYVMERPQVGAARALLSCGFDLSETPLLEAAVGRGRMILCQLDVTNRVESEPVATRLVENMLKYITTAPPPAPGEVALSALSAQVFKSAQTTNLYRSTPPEGPGGWGINAGDLYFRHAMPLPATSGPAPLFARARVGNRDIEVCSLLAQQIDDPWVRGKALRIQAALRINAGLSSDEGPSLVGKTDLYPVQWRQVERLKGPFDPYAYYRW